PLLPEDPEPGVDDEATAAVLVRRLVDLPDVAVGCLDVESGEIDGRTGEHSCAVHEDFHDPTPFVTRENSRRARAPNIGAPRERSFRWTSCPTRHVGAA